MAGKEIKIPIWNRLKIFFPCDRVLANEKPKKRLSEQTETLRLTNFFHEHNWLT